jgi:hypothetical protein
MAHNGMLPIEASNGRSDTRILAEDYIPSWGGARILNLKSKRKKLSKFADGSKLVFLSANPDVQNDFYIINERDGHWSNGVWWSNSSYKWKRYQSYSYSGSGLYTSGWNSTKQSPTPIDPNDDEFITQDVSFTDAHGNEVWAELWTCMACGEQSYIDEDNVDYADFCYSCDSCWFCSESRLICNCLHSTGYTLDESDNPLDDEVLDHPVSALAISNYDSTHDYF